MEQNQNRPRNPRRRTPFQRNRRMQAELLGTLLVGCVALMLVLGLLIKDKDFSENENRGLAQFPKFSFSAIADGSILSDFSSYVADQFPGRDMWMSLNLGVNQLLGQ